MKDLVARIPNHCAKLLALAVGNAHLPIRLFALGKEVRHWIAPHLERDATSCEAAARGNEDEDQKASTRGVQADRAGAGL